MMKNRSSSKQQENNVPEQNIEVPYQPYIILDEDTEEPAEGVLFVLRLDLEATEPIAQLAAREALLRYAAVHSDREHAKDVVRMVCQIKRMSPEASEELWQRVEDAHAGRKAYSPRPVKRRL